MGTFGREKRAKGRTNREVVVKLKIGQETKQVYMIDISNGGLKVGGVLLKLSLGAQVEVSIALGTDAAFFPGIVARQDGAHHINRIGRDGNTFFIRIEDNQFAEFVKVKFPSR
jgi:hypothetical protein